MWCTPGDRFTAQKMTLLHHAYIVPVTLSPLTDNEGGGCHGCPTLPAEASTGSPAAIVSSVVPLPLAEEEEGVKGVTCAAPQQLI